MSGRTPEEGRYSRVTRRMWNDEKFQKLSKAKPNGQTLWQRALCGPELGVIPGLFAAREGGLADHLEWPLAAFRRCWKEITDQKMAEADWRAGLVWVPNAIVHNEPNSTNAILGWRTPLRELPECPLKQKAIAALRAYCEAKGPLWVKAFDAACVDQKPRPSETPSGTPSPTPSPGSSPTASGSPSPTPSGMPSETPSGTPSCIQDQDQDTRTRSGSLAVDASKDLSGSRATGALRPEKAATAEVAQGAGSLPAEPTATSPIAERAAYALRNFTWFSFVGGVTWPEFRRVWDGWCKPLGIVSGPNTLRVDPDVRTVLEALANGYSVEDLERAGELAPKDPRFLKQDNPGPASFTHGVLSRLLKAKGADVRDTSGAEIAKLRSQRGGPPQPDAGVDPFSKHDAQQAADAAAKAVTQ